MWRQLSTIVWHLRSILIHFRCSKQFGAYCIHVYCVFPFNFGGHTLIMSVKGKCQKVCMQYREGVKKAQELWSDLMYGPLAYCLYIMCCIRVAEEGIQQNRIKSREVAQKLIFSAPDLFLDFQLITLITQVSFVFWEVHYCHAGQWPPGLVTNTTRLRQKGGTVCGLRLAEKAIMDTALRVHNLQSR